RAGSLISEMEGLHGGHDHLVHEKVAPLGCAFFSLQQLLGGQRSIFNWTERPDRTPYSRGGSRRLRHARVGIREIRRFREWKVDDPAEIRRQITPWDAT